MVELDVSIVTYRPDLAALASLADALREQAGGLALHVHVLDNSETDATAAIKALPAFAPGSGFASVDIVHSPENVGFGRGHNANAVRGHASWLLVLNQDCIVEPGALARLVALATQDAANVAAWEMRQIPYEHPKAYDPVSLDVEWVSGAATLFRRRAFEAVHGFDEHLFMYGEDVDLSWRLRAQGHRLRYVARCAVVHRTYAVPAEVKPLQALGGVRTNLCLRTRFGTGLTLPRGLALWAAEVLAPQEFAGRRRGMLKAFTGWAREWPHFRRTRVMPDANFAPHFAVWNYEERREGAFIAFRSQREEPRATTPRVSILIRTVGRTAWLAQALETVAHQTWPNVEAVVVEDGPATSQAIIDAFRDRIAIQYHATGDKVGRARAGNLALAKASGEWFNFLDDDDVLFADHVEVLLEAAERAQCKGAYGIAWETHTEVRDRDRAEYDEVARVTVHRQPFDRLTLWHHNFLPIQAVLFHRSLYEKHGGFAEDMDQLEDWNLWTRYTLDDDFVLVEKTTSKYRVPARSDDAASRQRLLDEAYRDAVARQAAMRLTTSPRAVSQMVDTYARSQSVVLVSRDDVRRFIGGNRLLAGAFAWRGPVMRRLRRFGSAR